MFFNTANNFSFDIMTVLKLQWDIKNDKSDNRHYHSISYRIKGDGLFVHDDFQKRVKTGDIAFVPAFYDYTLVATDEELIAIDFISENFPFDKITCFHSENPKYFERKFTELYDVWTKKQVGFEMECKSIIYKILARIEQEIAEKQMVNSHDKIHEAIEYMHENFTDNSMSVGALAKMCNMSDTYFRKLFVEIFNITPIDYIKSLKINYAQELLRSGYYNVREVSEKCGFNNVFYFSSFMKKETGKTPNELRKSNTL